MIKTNWAWMHKVGGLHCKKTGPGWTAKDEKKLWAWLKQCGGEKLFSRASADRIPVDTGTKFLAAMKSKFILSEDN